MCGIIGYLGHRKASEVITDGLRKLEYRGYDSVGIAVQTGNGLEIRKEKGMVDEVASALEFTSINGNVGIGHTRWATHGGVCRENSHPHPDCTANVVVAHNGVIENYLNLKSGLIQKGHKFASATDSEVISHLIEEHLSSGMSFQDAFQKAIRSLDGSYAVVALSKKDEQIVIARRNSPLIIGVGQGEMLCASDIPAMLAYTKTFIPLQEGDMAVLTKDRYVIYASDGQDVTLERDRDKMIVDWDVSTAQKGGYAHFMLKEIHDQPQVLRESLASDVSSARELLSGYDFVHVIAAGTSYHAGLVLVQLLAQQGKFAQAFIASDYPFVAKPNNKILLVCISQSGETADLLQAMRYAKDCKKIAITNTVGSTITRLADCSIFLNAGPEIGVAATKTFLAQLMVIYKLVYDKETLVMVASLVSKMLEHEEKIKQIATALAGKENVFFIARGRNVPIAYEGSLKFKEITYIHSEAYPGGELKHGTLSLISDGVPVIAIAPKDETLTKLFGNIKEVKARGGMVISITNDSEVQRESDHTILLPPAEETPAAIYPFVSIVPLQLLAYYVSVRKGINPDRPRNLAKSVTVE